jgi:hypothetical protein
MTTFMCKDRAREDLNLALVNEARAWRRLGRTSTCLHPAGQMASDRASAMEAAAVTKAAINTFAAACEEETRAGIAAWIAAAPARMDAQIAAGAQPLHYMHDIGQRAAAASLADAIRNKADLEKEKAGQ